MIKWFLGSLAIAGLLGFVVGCNLAYKPDVNVENATIEHQSGNTTQLKGEYNAR